MDGDANGWSLRVMASVVAICLMAGIVSPVAADHNGKDGTHGQGSTAKPVEAAEPGWMWVPTAGPDRLFQPISLHGVSLWYIDTISPGATFALEPQKQGAGVCVLGHCVQSGDFDIYFYAESDDGMTSVVERYESLGDESGTVPIDATFALVFLKTPNLVPDGGSGYGFYYRQGSPGSDRLPSIG